VRYILFGTWVAIAIGIVRALPAREPQSPDLKQIERHIASEPKYVGGQPFYGLLVFGPEAKTHAWAVFDKSSPDSATYDVLYFDRKADGNLTDPDDRIEGKPYGNRKDALEFKVGSFNDPATGDEYTGLSFIQHFDGPADHPLLVEINVKWQDKSVIHSGYSETLGRYASEKLPPQWNFSGEINSAPIFWFAGSAPLTFSGGFLKPLNSGHLQRVSVQLGFHGVGECTFTAVGKDFLPKEVPVEFTLEYEDTSGERQRITLESRMRYSGILYCGLMQIPKNARSGKAMLHCGLPKDSGYAFVPVDFPIELITPGPDTQDDFNPAPYDETADGSKQIADALVLARTNHKRVLLQFGANWCGWCLLLHDLFASDGAIHEELQADYVVVTVDVNEGHNKDIDAKYGNPTSHGLPVIVVLDDDGKQITTKDTTELEEGDHHSPEKVLAFLKQWALK
jgi:thiol-disulfide isomerase/thioredoxin